jgi:hypothetical protein
MSNGIRSCKDCFRHSTTKRRDDLRSLLDDLRREVLGKGSVRKDARAGVSFPTYISDEHFV